MYDDDVSTMMLTEDDSLQKLLYVSTKMNENFNEWDRIKCLIQN